MPDGQIAVTLFALPTVRARQGAQVISAYGDADGKVDAKAAGAIARAIREGFAAARSGAAQCAV